MLSKIQDKPVALITGAAGGIGRSISVKLDQRGYRLALADINKAGIEALKELLGSEHFFYRTDVTDPRQVSEMVTDLIKLSGRIDVLVNNAGMVVIKPFIQCSIDELKQENDLNYMAALYCIKEVLPYMQQVNKGCLVSVSSLGAILPMAASPNYTASKAALRGLMLSLYLALKPYNIHAGCVCPSAVDTRMLEMEAVGGGSLLNFLQEPLAPDQVAEAVWLVIDRQKAEVCLPLSEGLSSKLGGFFPALLPKILPRLEEMGEKKRLRYIGRKKLVEH